MFAARFAGLLFCREVRIDYLCGEYECNMEKKATTIEKQIELLRGRGVIISDKEKAKEILMDIGFYRLGFYAFPFEKTFPELKNRTHEYRPGTSFADIVDLYYFDYDLRRILMYYLNRIEVNVRTYITYTVSNYYKESPTWFVDTNIMNRKYAEEFETKVYGTIRENPVIKRHHHKYINDRFAPAWKTVEFMTLGNVCSLFNNLKDRQLKADIASYYKCGLGVFINYLETIRVIRNTCAHGGCIYNLSLAKAIKGSRQVPVSDANRHNIKGVIDVIRYIVGIVSENRQEDLDRDIVGLLRAKRSPKTNEIIEKCTGFAVK